MANITRIKAGDSNRDKKQSQSDASGDRPKAKSTAAPKSPTPKSTESNSNKLQTAHHKAAKSEITFNSAKPADKTKKSRKSGKKSNRKPLPMPLRIITWPFRMIAKPFIAIGHYIHGSWLEIRQVRWPSRGATWKMVLAVFVYSGIFMIFIMLLDALFTFIFNNLLG